MQLYVYMTTIAAMAVLGWFGHELVGQPMRSFFALRRKALEQMRVLGNIQLPRPRELAISSLEIREYDQAVANVRSAQRTFRNLGFLLLAFAENEPAACNALRLLGFHVVAAGSELIKLSDTYPRPGTDRAGLQNQIKSALGVTDAIPATSRLTPTPRKRDRILEQIPRTTEDVAHSMRHQRFHPHATSAHFSPFEPATAFRER